MTLMERLQHPSARPVGEGITLGTPRLYDLTADLFFFGRRGAYRKLVEAANVHSGQRALDVGSGPGYLGRMLATAVGPTGSVVGIDAAPEMVEYANRKSARLGNCTFQAASADALPFPDAGFDVVMSSLVMHHLPEDLRRNAVSEMRRVLKPGGTLLLADFNIPERGIWHVVAAVTGHAASEMAARVRPLEPMIAEAGFEQLRSGDAPPWLHYVRAIRPVA